MKLFLSDNFLLNSNSAQQLYSGYAQDMPIIDYHCHLPPAEIASNKKFENLTEIWLTDDHYKWRAMRTLGIDEYYITGEASDKEKFSKWAETVPHTMRNPLYHWSHLELKMYFGIEDLLTPENANQIYDFCSNKLQDDAFRSQSLLQKKKVEIVCTTDDPTDSLEHHKALQKDSKTQIDVRPTFRPDKAYSFNDVEQYNNYINSLGESTDHSIQSFDDLMMALEKRLNYFGDHGTIIADHGLPYIPPRTNTATADSAFKDIRSGQTLSISQEHALTFQILLELGRMYHSRGWVQQFHLGPLRNTNQRKEKEIGADTGFDSIGDFNHAQPLAHFMDTLDQAGQLPKTILYNNNPADNAVMASMIGNFNDGSIKSKIQHGTAWWHMDQKDGIERHLNTLSNLSLLSCFIGMVTDSRSFLSYSRHDYFRRILCNLIGEDIENGLLPNDIEWLGTMVSNICYANAKEYFNF